jgi:hypothetical protein
LYILQLCVGWWNCKVEPRCMKCSRKHLCDYIGDCNWRWKVTKILGRLPQHNSRKNFVFSVSHDLLNRFAFLGCSLRQLTSQKSRLNSRVNFLADHLCVGSFETVEHLLGSSLQSVKVIEKVGHLNAWLVWRVSKYNWWNLL